ncbi:universal stress protein [Seohaeicola zhoushanensis]|uniref:Universal stress protein UspA n=1 Tax=Seohaeicola zhoushanensis TaxID=1569283 RepID=A0A8J3GZX5_9RHOB|nr:universal stress protein [Seohaeicola zhoushanensis]GHF56834.1 universal stress protein UspA [Seohaeicola zhoushanensis]
MFDKVLLPIDLTYPESWDKALPAALKCAGTGGEVHLLGIVHDLGSAMVASFLPADFEKQAIARMQTALEEFQAKHLAGDPRVQLHVGHGHVPETILKVARKLDADLIVMASHPHGDLGTLLVGSNADKVVRHADRPVLVVR